jgi:hypothetical protein
MSVEHRWDDTCKKHSERNLFQYNLAQQNLYVDGSGIEPGPPLGGVGE